MKRPLWVYAAGLYWLFIGAVQLFSLNFDGINLIIAILAFAAGLLLLLDR